eukprot:scaffold140_cov247-Pinguiococcus_pyrenoidosus.AAC.15
MDSQPRICEGIKSPHGPLVLLCSFVSLNIPMRRRTVLVLRTVATAPGSPAAKPKPRLHERQPRLEGVISIRDVVLHGLLTGARELAAHELDKLVLHVLDEIQPRRAVLLHHEDREVVVRLPDAVVQHANQDVRIVRELHHQLLLLLDHLEAGFVNQVRVVVKQVGFRAQLHPDRAGPGVVALQEHLHFDRLQGANLRGQGRRPRAAAAKGGGQAALGTEDALVELDRIAPDWVRRCSAGLGVQTALLCRRWWRIRLDRAGAGPEC